LLACIPGVFEGTAITVLGPRFLPLTTMEAALLGFILAAVSPAVVVPLMIHFIEEKRGAKKALPTMVLAAASLDDVFAITIFTILLGLYSGHAVSIGGALAGIPISILLGIGAGVLASIGAAVAGSAGSAAGGAIGGLVGYVIDRITDTDEPEHIDAESDTDEGSP